MLYRYNFLSSTLGNIHAILISRISRRVTEVGYFWLRLIVINLIRLGALKKKLRFWVSAEFDRWCWTKNISGKLALEHRAKDEGTERLNIGFTGLCLIQGNPKVISIMRVFKNHCYFLRSLLFVLFILLEPLQNSPSLFNSKFLGTLKYKIHK